MWNESTVRVTLYIHVIVNWMAPLLLPLPITLLLPSILSSSRSPRLTLPQGMANEHQWRQGMLLPRLRSSFTALLFSPSLPVHAALVLRGIKCLEPADAVQLRLGSPVQKPTCH